jgi:hypothetical protein
VNDLARACASWSDQWWDERAALPWAPPGHEAVADGARLHMVPQAARYSLALLERADDGDLERARECLAALCELQYDEPGTDIHGTFRIFAETPHPPAQPVMWDDYDPNWRQFLGTIFVLVLRRHADALPGPLRDRLVRAVTLAVDGEPPRRIPPSYANIALMHAWLQVEAGIMLDRSELVEVGETFAHKIVERFDRHGCFDEYNSPTYYGIDLEALALWRSWSSSAHLTESGAVLEHNLWNDLAEWYHPGLRNLCGPFTRAYGLDMTTHLGALGLWFADAFGIDGAPLPPMTPDTPHGHDWFHGPYVALLGARIPEDARHRLTTLDVVHVVSGMQIDDDPERVATCWLGEDVMFGAERCTADLSWWEQFKPATGHWRRDDGLTGAFEIRAPGPSDATVALFSLSLTWSHDAGDGLAHMIVQRPNGRVRLDGRVLHLGEDRRLHLEGTHEIRSISEPTPHAHGEQVTIVLGVPEGAPRGTLYLTAVA